MSTSVKLSTDVSGKNVEQSLYRSMIESLLYLTASRPDFAFNVRVYARFQANPKKSHLVAIKHILRYVNETINYEIWYSRYSNTELEGHFDAD